jgi:hypothetical protein
MFVKPVIAVLGVALAVGGASIASARDDNGGGRTIRLTAKSTGVALVENGQAGINRGDRFISSGDLLRDGQKVGVAALDCVVIAAGPPQWVYQCTNTASLPGGQLAFQGLVTSEGVTPSGGTAAVTGGTDRYRRAHGQATLTLSQAGLQGDLVIDLR